jgi:NAD(P)-dependent dehydrogenase (short-subunit alcohol dehydrogenase family)
MDFSGKHVVVTGGSGALGAAVVTRLLELGAICTVPYVHDREAERVPFRNNSKAKLIKVSDLSDETEVAKVYAGGALWASIQTAGGFAPGKVADTDRAALMAQIDGNLVSCFLCCRAAVNAMLAGGQGANIGGRIVNVTARPALEPRSGAGMAAYAVAKSGVAALTVTLAEEAAKDGILVNAVAPSIMDTPANRAAMPKANFDAWPKVEEVAATILFLASPDNKVTRGAIVPVYGKS